MPRRSKIVDEDEALRMLRGGATYPEMVRFYRAKYGIETNISLWSRFYRKHNPDEARLVLHYRMIPWELPGTYLGARLGSGLRAIGRASAGEQMSPSTRMLAVNLKKRLLRGDTVVDFDYEVGGFVEVPRRHGIDQGWIRDPFLDDTGALLSADRLPALRTESILAYEDSGGLSVQDSSRPLPEGEERRGPIEVSLI